MTVRSWARRLAALCAGCGTLPLLAAVAFVLAPVLRAEGGAGPEVARPAVVDPEVERIDAVLVRRAPELGATLRGQLAAAIAGEARRAGFDPLLIVAMIDVESDFEGDAVSAKGARGLMQIRPSTLQFLAETEGLRLSSDEVSRDAALQVRLGIRYLKRLHGQFGDLDLALMAYNAGPARIREALREDGLEGFRRYARLVQRDYMRFRGAMGLAGDWAVAAREE